MVVKYRVYLIKFDELSSNPKGSFVSVHVTLLDDDENTLGSEFDSKQDAQNALSRATKIQPMDGGRSRIMDRMSGHKFKIDEEYS